MAAWDPEWARQFLVEHTYVPTPEFARHLIDQANGIFNGPRAKGRTWQECYDDAVFTVLDFAFADRFGGELLDFHRHGGDVRDPETGRTIDCKFMGPGKWWDYN